MFIEIILEIFYLLGSVCSKQKFQLKRSFTRETRRERLFFTKRVRGKICLKSECSFRLESGSTWRIMQVCYSLNISVYSSMYNIIFSLVLSGWTPLHEACVSGDESVVEELLRAGANVNALSCEGVTPLHDAVYGGHHQVKEKTLKECFGI